MQVGKKELIVVGDRVLVKLEKPEDRTEAGLYLPQTAVDKARVQSGRVVEVGPGIPVPTMDRDHSEPWQENFKDEQFIPLQAEIGDFAFFLKDEATDLKLEGEEYVIVPQHAILVLLREDWVDG